MLWSVSQTSPFLPGLLWSWWFTTATVPLTRTAPHSLDYQSPGAHFPEADAQAQPSVAWLGVDPALATFFFPAMVPTS